MPHQRTKAMDLLNKDKLLFLVTCPMCGPFSNISDHNYGKINENEINENEIDENEIVFLDQIFKKIN